MLSLAVMSVTKAAAPSRCHTSTALPQEAPICSGVGTTGKRSSYRPCGTHSECYQESLWRLNCNALCLAARRDRLVDFIGIGLRRLLVLAAKEKDQQRKASETICPGGHMPSCISGAGSHDFAGCQQGDVGPAAVVPLNLCCLLCFLRVIQNFRLWTHGGLCVLSEA